MKYARHGLFVFIFVIGVLPIAWMFGASLWSAEGLSLKHYAALFQEARVLKLLGNTTVLALLTVAGALLLGVPLAFVFCFGDLGATLIVYSAGGATLPIRLYTIMANSPESVTAAMSVILVLPILLAVFLVVYLSRFLFTR
jgi:iron(III) transport system permease protein